ncbi:DNA-3-methyladenine glycosylase 2 family protein [Sanguibacter sp. HDW7]|nr:DNA-3-methyladenine glycosylase 2 family protein [Sanguibacter sp. HDW7]
MTLRASTVEVRTPGDPGPGLAATVTRWFRLDDDTRPAEARLAADPLLAPLVAARPGLRPLGHPEPFEAAVTAVLGQQVSLAAARTFAGRLVDAFGSPGPAGLRAFPDAGTLASVPVDELRAALGVTGARARTLAGLALAVAGGLDLRAAGREELLALPGVGPWTADVLALRLGADDVVCAGDLVLRRTLDLPDTRAVERRAEAWTPYRSTALWHLWAAAVYA